jgi:hypothetical protein
VVWFPLVLLAIPSVVIGYIAIGSMLGGDFFNGAIFVDLERHPPWSMWPNMPPSLSRWGCTRS